MNDRNRTVIVGTGALACLYAARLAPHTAITMLGTWQEGLEVIRESGVRLMSPDGPGAPVHVHTTSDPSECEGVSKVLILVKSWQTERAARQVASFLPEEGLALTLQNGLGNFELLGDLLGYDRVTQGVTTMGATLEAPGSVRAGGEGLTHIAHHPKIDRWVELFTQAGIKVDVTENVEELVWGKLTINAGINPLTALLEVPNGELIKSQAATALMHAAAQEAANVAGALDIGLPFTNPARAIDEVAKSTAANISSMLQDIRRGAPTEIDAISGAIWKEGERLGVPVPISWTLWQLVRAKGEGRGLEA
ncbi:MAG: ketopantoate reductase family protein [Anaerolineales bacterium]